MAVLALRQREGYLHRRGPCQGRKAPPRGKAELKFFVWLRAKPSTLARNKNRRPARYQAQIARCLNVKAIVPPQAFRYHMPMFSPRVIIAAAHSGAGKSTVSLALMAAFAGQGMDVRPFKVGPDYIDPGLHQAACGRLSHNLDAWLMPEAALYDLFYRHAPQDNGIALIEGVMGLFDGLAMSPVAGTAHVAAMLRAPVLLVINAKGMSLSTAALVKGFAAFAPQKSGWPDLSSLHVAGVIVNHTSGPRHAGQLARIIEDHSGIACLGHLPAHSVPPLPERYMGLVPAAEQPALAPALARLAEAARQYLDLDAIMRIAQSAPPLPVPAPVPAPAPAPVPEGQGILRHALHPAFQGLRLGIAKDAAFSFYYHDGLAVLEEMGAELVPFSPLADKDLPGKLHGLYLGGGFPEMFAEQLEQNSLFRNALHAALEAGMPAYAECGGMLYLCKSVISRPQAPARDMTAFFPHRAVMTGQLQPFGYGTLTLDKDCLLGPAGRQFHAHEFHYSRIDGPEHGETPKHADLACAENCLRMEKVDGRFWHGGLAKKATLAGYPHLHFRGCPEAAHAFLCACAAYAGRLPGNLLPEFRASDKIRAKECP